jgi:hypothetical protein
MHMGSKPLLLLLTCCIFIQYGYSQVPYVRLSERLERVAYLIDGIRPHVDYYPPGYAEKGRFVLEYWFKPGEAIPTEAEERAVMLAIEQIVIRYGFADSAKYFDTSFMKLVPVSGRLPYPSNWAFSLSSLKINPANEEHRFHALLDIVPFDHGEYFTADSAYIYLYQTNISPSRDLQAYATTLAQVVQSFAFDRPRRSVCIFFYNDKKILIQAQCNDFTSH